MGGPSSQINSLNRTTETTNKLPDHNDPRTWLNSTDKFNSTKFSQVPYSTIQEEHDPIELTEEADIVAEEIKLPKKNRLKDMITQVPQNKPDYPHTATKSTNEYDQNNSSNRPYEDEPSMPINQDINEEEEIVDENESDEEGEYNDQQPDVQKIHFNQTVSALYNIKQYGLEAPPFDKIAHYLVELPEPNAPHKTKTIVFDLDETLIHCVDDVDRDNPDVIIPIKFTEEPEAVLAGINIRPYAIECLKAANQHFQVVVFTASEQEYADPIIDYLDPDGDLI